MPESQIVQVLVAAINQAWCDKDTFLVTLQKNIETVLESEKSQPLTDIDKRLAEKITVYEDKFTVEFKSGVTVDMDE